MTAGVRKAPDFSDLPGFQPGHFTRMARMSEKGLLDLLWNLAEADNIAALTVFVWNIQATGSPGPMYDKNTGINTRSGLQSYPVVFAHAMRSQSTSFTEPLPWSREQEDLFHHLMVALQTHPERTGFLKDLATQGTGNIQDPRFFEAIHKAIGPLDHLVPAEDWESASNRMVSLLERAVLKQNTVAIEALIKPWATDQVDALLERLCHVEMKTNRPLTNAILEMPDADITRVLAALEAQADPLALSQSRFALLDGYLSDCLHSETPWKVEQIKVIAGNDAFDPEKSKLMPAIVHQTAASTPQTDPSVKRPHSLKSPVVMAMGEVISTHCVPLMEVMSPLMRAWADPANPLPKVFGFPALLQQSNEQGSDPIWNIDNFKACYRLMEGFGHEAKTGSGTWASLCHVLANGPLQQSHAQKLVALLDLGNDPHAIDGNGKTAFETVHEDIAPEWRAITSSHKARNTAHGILNDLEENPKSKMGPRP